MVENTIASQLKRLRKSRGWTQTQLADKLSVSKQTISNWETGTKVPRMGSLQNLADLFHVKIGEITNASIIKEETQSHLPTNIIYPLGDDFERISIPLIGEIACGDPITADENIEGYVEEIFEKPVPKGNLFALRCKGKSMEPTIHDGSIVTIREQPTVEDGEIAAVLVDGDNEATLKRVKHQGNLIMLMPDNKEFDPIILDKDNPGRIVGKAVHVSWSIK
ncbi:MULTISPECIES: LexA family transcriptional regulator [Lactobacillales]|uniref:Transcriptional regulator, XRE family n=1 Tax=Limosilactobacillus reuteri subsp. rodentium (strain DSM 17509 / CIP 109821 / 100-23) TaxID=349123 RepID=B3XLT2_LIMR1|nr:MULTISPECIES: XRE family transcriptional regulator [Lactobacillales]EDX42386.1 transcriptional regulator, XRE family [Limosilactobacillus reuteri subsp. rodentium]MCC4475477.1 XRE family transcriptional regulator [Limosilactobacillus reuteri]MDY4510099.1 XRE family transcriptional regulator [Streptococcus hyovaginalis]